MEPMGMWETILLGAVAILAIMWLSPGIRGAMRRSEEAEKDWRGVLLPLGMMVLFVVVLIWLARG